MKNNIEIGSRNNRLLLLVLLLAINSFQLAVAASSSLLEKADSRCHESMSHQHETGDHRDMVSHGCCEEKNAPSDSCATHLCCDSNTAPSILFIADPLQTASSPVSEIIESTFYALHSRYFAVELRPPRA